MRYHYEKPKIYKAVYGTIYACDHPVYAQCTLYLIGYKGLAVIQQRYDQETKPYTCDYYRGEVIHDQED